MLPAVLYALRGTRFGQFLNNRLAFAFYPFPFHAAQQVGRAQKSDRLHPIHTADEQQAQAGKHRAQIGRPEKQ